MIVVGVCQFEVNLHGNDSLKGKRSVVKRIVARVQAKFRIDIAEVEEQDTHELAVLAFAVVGNDRRHVNARLDKIMDFIESIAEAPLGHQEFDYITY